VHAWTRDEKRVYESECEGTMEADADVDRATHSLKHYSGKCEHGFALPIDFLRYNFKIVLVIYRDVLY